MAKYRKKPVVIDAEQWFKNGDHSKDHDPIGIKNPTSQDMERYYDYRSTEGEVVRRYRAPSLDGQTLCKYCGKIMHDHGWIDTPEGGHIVCPGDWIVEGCTTKLGIHHWPVKPDYFAENYEKV